MAQRQRPFHLAFPVFDLEATRRFYVDLLGCAPGREAERWLDLNLFGNQVSAHLVDGEMPSEPTNAVDGDAVPVRHFGAVLEWSDWEALAARLERAGIEFLIQPKVRFRGQPGEQGTFFLRDPSGNVLEFKTFRDDAQIFARV